MQCAASSPSSSLRVAVTSRWWGGHGSWLGRGELPLPPGCLVVRGVGATVYVAIGLQAVLGCSHHV